MFYNNAVGGKHPAIVGVPKNLNLRGLNLVFGHPKNHLFEGLSYICFPPISRKMVTPTFPAQLRMEREGAKTRAKLVKQLEDCGWVNTC